MRLSQHLAGEFANGFARPNLARFRALFGRCGWRDREDRADSVGTITPGWCGPAGAPLTRPFAAHSRPRDGDWKRGWRPQEPNSPHRPSHRFQMVGGYADVCLCGESSPVKKSTEEEPPPPRVSAQAQSSSSSPAASAPPLRLGAGPPFYILPASVPVSGPRTPRLRRRSDGGGQRREQRGYLRFFCSRSFGCPRRPRWASPSGSRVCGHPAGD
jgi:hypothetical protein